MTKTQKILAIYHLLTHCHEVQVHDITRLMPNCGKKTLQRGIRLLKDAGVPVCYRRSEPQAYTLSSTERSEPRYPADRAGSIYLDKIIRLITVMEGMKESDDLLAWYRQRFPGVSLRTMQRDFAVLNSIGYVIRYEREGHFPSEGNSPRYHWHYNHETYSLDIFSEGEME